MLTGEQKNAKAAEIVKSSCFKDDVTSLTPITLDKKRTAWLKRQLSWDHLSWEQTRVFATDETDRWVTAHLQNRPANKCAVILHSNYTDQKYAEMLRFDRYMQKRRAEKKAKNDILQEKKRLKLEFQRMCFTMFDLT